MILSSPDIISGRWDEALPPRFLFTGATFCPVSYTHLDVYKRQGKHVPVSPTEAFLLYRALADEIRDKYEGQRLLIIGFAETATAIGASLAVEMDSFYMQTTRENAGDVKYLYFSESHSHATEQKLVRDDLDRVIAVSYTHLAVRSLWDRGSLKKIPLYV